MQKLVSFFEIPAVDFDRAVKFYESLFSIKMERYDDRGEKLAFFPAEDGLYPGAISLAKGFNPSVDGVLVSLTCKDVEQTLKAAVSNGGKQYQPKTKILADGRGYFGLFIDSEGNKVGLYSDW